MVPIAHPLGTVSQPSVTPTGDPDSGRWSPGANILADSVGGAEIIRYASNQVTVTGGTITASKPGLLLTQTWNNSSVTFDGGLRVDITNTASFAGSQIIVARVGGAVKAAIDKTGDYIIGTAGFRAGLGKTAETTNTVFGYRCNELTTGNGGYNVSVGYEAGQNIDGAGGNNVAVGIRALKGSGSGAFATGSVNLTAGNAADGDTFTINGKVFTFQTTLTNVDGNVLIGASASASATNLKNAILGTGGTPGTDYAAATVTHTTVSASVATTTVTITALTAGSGGNAYTLAKSGANLAVSAATLSGGTDKQSGSYNTALGTNAMYYARTASQNMAVGAFALQNFLAGSSNLAIGYSSLLAALGGSNVGLGSFTLANCDSSAAEKNIAIGYNAGLGVLGSTTGYENVFIGFEAGKAFTTGIRNTFIGHMAGDATTTGSRNIVIGYNCDAPSATTSDSLNIGNLIKGDMAGAIMTVAGSILPEADGTRNIGSGALRFNTVYATTGAINTSDERYKVIREGGALNAAELAAWGRVRTIVYQDKASYDEWGAAAARLHVGYGWDAIRQAFEAEGLDAARYGLWCSDPVLAPQTRIEILQREVIGEDGMPVTELRPLILGDGTPAMMDERKVVIDMVPTEVPVMEPFVETWLDIETVDGAKVAVARTRDAKRQASDLIPVLLEDGSQAMTDPTGIEGDEGYEPPKPVFVVVPRTQLVDVPVEREEVTSVPRMQEVAVYETFEHEVVEMVPTGEVRGALRYSECAVLEAAWLRHQLATLAARVAALEAA